MAGRRVGGGGQPIHDGASWQPSAVRCCGAWMPLRTFASRTRIPMVQACYREFLGEALSPLAEELLHTDHHAWSMPNEGTC